MKILTGFEQNSLEWLSARAGVITASDFDNLFTPKMKPRTGQMVETYLAQKLAERWLGGPLPSFMGIDMDFGKILEEEAKPLYELTTGEAITSVAFITTDDGKIGCSPDGLLGDGSGIEIKCPKAETHVGYLLDGTVPEQYLPQIYGSLFVSGRSDWRFMSYRRRFPALILDVKRDEKIMQVMGETLSAFSARLDAAFDKLCELNGGPPPPRQMTFNQSPQPQPESDQGIIP